MRPAAAVDVRPLLAVNDRWLRTLAYGLPSAVLLVSFVAVCVQAGTPWPWTSVVHEDGRRTLLQTIFYFEHATRELLLDGVLAVAIAGAVRLFEPVRTGRDAALERTRRNFGIAAIASLAAILGGTACTEGTWAIAQNLAQLHTREGAPLAWGAHWRYHFIERIAEIALAFCVTGVLAGRRGGTGSASLFLLAIGMFGGLSIAFGVSGASFRDPTYVGHQLRELLTNVLVTLPMALGGCLLLARRFSRGVAIPAPSAMLRWPIAAAGLTALACGAYLLAAALLLGSRSHGQKAGLAELVFPHFFEHSLGYAFVTSAAGWLYLRGALRPGARRRG